MKIVILGTRGIPNNHGGFEQFAEYFSVYLASKNHDVYVYNPHDHPYQENFFKGVNIIHAFDPEYKIGAAGQFIYDLNCIRDSRKRKFDLILQLGYTSSTIWYWLLPKKSIIVTNMDGLEWKRSKYNKPTRKFLKFAEKLGALHSDYLIADSIGVREYLLKTYNKTSKFIAYGAEIFENPTLETQIYSKYNVTKYQYSMIIARLEPENNIEMILDGYNKSKTKNCILVFGKLNAFGLSLKEKYKLDKRIKFVGANYDTNELNNLRYFSRYYFHGHSVGGTNPSLLEAMSSKALIIAHNNIFNKSVLEKGAIYFENYTDIIQILNDDNYFKYKESNWLLNKQRIQKTYSWDIINKSYEDYLKNLLK